MLTAFYFTSDDKGKFVYYHRQEKRPPPHNHLDIGALRLPTLGRNQAGDWLMQY